MWAGRVSQFNQHKNQTRLTSTTTTSSNLDELIDPSIGQQPTQVSEDGSLTNPPEQYHQLEQQEEEQEKQQQQQVDRLQDRLPRATLEQKIRALDWFHKNSTKSQRSTVKYFQSLNEFSIAKSSFNRWVKEETQIRSDYAKISSFNKDKIKTRANYKFPLVDDALLKFYEQSLYEHGINFERGQITGNDLIAKWFQFAKAFRYDFHDMKKTHGWLQHFKRKTREKTELILNFKKSEESYFTGCIQDEKVRLRSIISTYKPCDVFHFDEFSITSRLLPSDHKGIEYIVGLGMNSNNTEFLPLMKVSTSNSEELKMDLFHYQSNTGSLTNEIFYKYMTKVNKSIATSSHQNRKILILVDKLYEHIIPKLDHIDLCFFNSNNQTFYSNLNQYNPLGNNIKRVFDTEIQPLNTGVIKNFKLEFKMNLIKHHITYLESNNVNSLKPVTTEMIYDLLKTTFKTIQCPELNKILLKCWELSGLLPWADNRKNGYDQFNITFRKETEINFWKSIGILQSRGFLKISNISPLNIDQILFPLDEYVMNRHKSDQEIVTLVQLQAENYALNDVHKNDEPSDISHSVEEHDTNQSILPQLDKKTLSQMSKLLNSDLSTFFQKNKQLFPESSKSFTAFMNDYIRESMDLYFDDYQIEEPNSY